MGEARDRMKLGLAPRILKPGEQMQFQVDLKDAVPKLCECGSEFFVPVLKLFTVSALVSPLGKETIAQVPALVCFRCKVELK
jgi:hypothetical protein